MSVLELKLFGGLNISADGSPLRRLNSQKGMALLCYLAVTHKHFSRSTLAGLFWSDMPETSALMNLRKVLNRIKPVAPYLTITRNMLGFNIDAPYWLDVDEFCKAAEEEADIHRLQYAVSLYQGNFMEGFSCESAPLFADWILGEREKLREIALDCLQKLVWAFTGQQDYLAAIRFQRQILEMEPWQEEAHREMMLLLAKSGQRIAALHQYETCRSILSAELGVELDIATVQLYEQIRTNQIRDDLPSHQSTMTPGRHAQSNLPAQTTPFIGRGAELTVLHKYLVGSDVRLVTIIGPGGIGKTRLALAAAYQQVVVPSGSAFFSDGVYYISLAGVGTPNLLLPAVAEAIAFRFTEGDDPAQQLLQFLRHKKMLLVLDNYEHLLGGTGLIDEILRVAPAIKLLITSREKLNRQAEYLLPVGGMDYPLEVPGVPYTAQELADYSAIQLFQQSARRVLPGFDITHKNQQAVLGICRLVQGMPLGIVLAAAWMEMLTPYEIYAEMSRDLDFLITDVEDVPDRQRSLRAAFNYSWRRLSENERRIFCQLSVFRGGFTYQAAKIIVGATLQDFHILVNKSLMSPSNSGRYDIHELLRQFAAKELADFTDQEAAVRKLHSAYYCTFLQQHTQNWHTARQLDTLSTVTAEVDNAQTAWDWAVSQNDWPNLLRATDSWASYHIMCGRFTDGEALWKEVSDQAQHQYNLEIVHDADGLRMWAKALAWQGRFSFLRFNALQKLEDALSLLERPELSDQDTRADRAFIFFNCGAQYTSLDRKTAREHLEASLSLYQELNDSWGIAVSLMSLGNLDWGTGRYAPATERIQASLEILYGLGDVREQINAKNHLSWVYKHQGRLDETEQLRRETVNLSRQINDHQLLIICTANLAYVLWWQGQLMEMRQWAETCVKMVQDYGFPGLEGIARLALCTAWLEMGQYEQARQEAVLSLANVRRNNEYGVEATVHFMLGRLAIIEDSQSEAQAEFKESYRLYQEVQDNLLGFALAGLQLMAGVFTDLRQARSYSIEALENALKLHDSLLLWFALPGISLYLARAGEVIRAVEVWALAKKALIINHSQWFDDVVGERIRSSAANLPPGVADMAGQRGQALDMWQTAEQLLVEFLKG